MEACILLSNAGAPHRMAALKSAILTHDPSTTATFACNQSRQRQMVALATGWPSCGSQSGQKLNMGKKAHMVSRTLSQPACGRHLLQGHSKRPSGGLRRGSLHFDNMTELTLDFHRNIVQLVCLKQLSTCATSTKYPNHY